MTTLTLALTLAGCGGGGDSAGTPTTAASRTVAGTAAKGILKGATVNAYAIGADGKQGTTAIATGTTLNDGSFSIKIPTDVLSFIVEVSGGPNATSADEASGVDVPVGAGFKLRNVVKLAAAGETTYTGSVSPLTEMIVKTAEGASGGLSAANIDSAKAGFAAFFGFSPEQVKPVNSNSAAAATANAQEKLQSVMLAAISKLAKDGKLGCAETTPGAQLGCVVGKIGALGTIKGNSLEVNDALSGAIDTAATEVVADTTINQTGNTSVAPLPKGTVPILPPAASGVQAAKNLFASLRSNLTALSNGNHSGAIDLRADAMRADFEQAVAPLDDDLSKWMQLSTNGIDFLRAYQAGSTTSNTLEVYAGATKLGGCGVYSDADGSVAATSAADALTVGCSIVRKTVPGSYTTGLSPNTYKRVTAAFTITPVGDTSYTYVSRARLETWNVGASERNRNLDVTVGVYGDTPNARATGSINYVRNGNTLSTFSVEGTMPARTDDYGNAVTDRASWTLSATRTAEGNKTFKYAFSGAIAAIKAGQQVGKVSIAAGSFLRTVEANEGRIVATGVKEFSLSLAAEAGGSKAAGTLVMSEAMADKNGQEYMPTKLSFTGNLATANAEFFTGTLKLQQTDFDKFDSALPESATNYVKKSAALAGKLSIPNRPALGISLNAGSNAFHSSSLTGQYNDGASLINFSVTDANHGVTPKLTTFASSDGVTMALSGAADSVDVLKDNAKVGVLNLKTGRIDYADGIFESLK
ncbi:hypothetical protein OIK44_08630 [Janthinobacterium sp. hw3]|uniref:Uncharacterized protein n=2 Tax=Janthinobacterium fluminis TaxID=2987524 RepID=A0ABT5JYY8_9BURK|nr:hypothetical protein [Janthinobacterium fluminis]